MSLVPALAEAHAARVERNPLRRLFSFWTANDIAILRNMARKQATCRAIATALCRSEGSIRQKATELNLSVHKQMETRPIVDLEDLAAVRPFERGAFILARVAAAYGLSVDMVKSEGRHKDLVQARHHAIHLIAKLTSLSLPQMATIVGRSNHTTMIHAIRLMNDRTGENVRGVGGVRPERVLRARRYRADKIAARLANAA